MINIVTKLIDSKKIVNEISTMKSKIIYTNEINLRPKANHTPSPWASLLSLPREKPM